MAMNWLRSVLVGLLLLATLRAQDAAAASLHLKSGRVLEGRLLVLGKEEVWFEDDEIGVVRVPALRIRSVEPIGREPDVFSVGFHGSGEPAPGTFVRHRRKVNGPLGALEVAVSRFHAKETGLTLFLVGVVHVGESAYYERLQSILDSCDLVLWEGVRPAPGQDREALEAAISRFDGVRGVQNRLADLLGLKFQMDEVDYDRPFWTNADVDIQTLQSEMDKRNVALPGEGGFEQMILKLAFGILGPRAQDEAGRQRLRGQFGGVMAMADKLIARMSGLHDVLIRHRNEIAWAKMLEALPQRREGEWIALFYGAAHMPDFATRALAHGFEHQGTAWLPAWTTR